MCVNQYWLLNKHTGRYILVKCGVCASCSRNKAKIRASRIKRNIRTFPKNRYFFVTLSYENEFIPFIKADEHPSFVENSYDKACRYSYFINVYRKSTVFRYYNRHTKRYKLIRNTSDSGILIDKLPLKTGFFDPSGCIRPVKHSISNSIAICYSKDVSNFLKRLRVNLKRYYNYNGILKFYRASEYGPTTLRPHIHILLEFPESCQIPSYQLKRAVASSWSFCNIYKRNRSFEIAYNPADYLSQYINCGSDFPPLLQNLSLRPKTSHSLYYGIDFNHYSYSYISKCIRSRSMVESVEIIKDGKPICVDMRIPKYITNYYFPYIKGLSSLTPSQAFYALLHPEQVGNYFSPPYYRMIDYDNFISKVNLSLSRVGDFSYSARYDWASNYLALIRLNNSDALVSSYNDVVTDTDFVQHFDNLQYIEYNDTPLLGMLGIDYFSYTDDDIDPNKVPRNVIPSLKLEQEFYDNIKVRKLNEYSRQVENELFYY